MNIAIRSLVHAYIYRIFIPILVAVLMFFPLSERAHAAQIPPQILTYQGRLTDSGGNLLGGVGTTYYFKFSIWDNPTVGNGTRVWPANAPTSIGTTVKQGVFTINIGDTTNGYPDALNLDFSNSPNFYLQVEASSNNSTFETLSPRQQLTSAVFAQIVGAVVGTTTPSVFGTTTPITNSFVTISATSSDSIPLSIVAAFNQVANLFQIQNSANENLFSVNATGGISAIAATTTSLFSTTASSTNLFTSNLSIGSLSGFLKATAGAVATALVNLASDVTGILPIGNGGTGTSTPPSYGQLLVGTSGGAYQLTATSSLGLLSGLAGNALTKGYFIIGDDSDLSQATSSIFISSLGNLGIGTTSPYAKLSVVGETVSSYFTATSTTATSTFAGSVSLPAGAVGAPSINFGSATTGLYAPAAGQLAITKNGVQKLLINSAGNIVVSAPNASAGALQMSIDATGFAQTAYGFKCTTGTLGTISNGICFSSTANDVGAGGSRAFYGTGNSPTLVEFAGTASAGSVALIRNDTVAGKILKLTSTATVGSATSPLYISLTGTGTAGRFVSFNRSDGEKFYVTPQGDIISYGALVFSRGTIGRYQNMLTYSEQFDNAAWVKSGVTVTADYATAPDGTLTTADRILGVGGGTVKQTTTGTTASKTFTFSVWLKKLAEPSGTVSVRIDSTNETGTQSIMELQTDIWYLMTVTQTFTSGSTGAPIAVIRVDGTGDVVAFGANLSETTTTIGYAATSASALSTMLYGSVTNGKHTIYGAYEDTGLIIRAGGNQGSTNLLDIQNNTGSTLASFTSAGTFKPLTGTTTLLPIQMTSGTLLTTALAGGIEFLTDDFYGTITTGAARKKFVLDDGTALTSGRVPFATTNGRLTDSATLVFDGTNLGIGTTSPYSMLSVAGQVVGQNFTATSTTATSTFAGDILTASSTSALSSGNYPWYAKSGVADGASAVGFQFDTTNTINNTTSKVLSIKTGGTEIFKIGTLTTGSWLAYLKNKIAIGTLADGNPLYPNTPSIYIKEVGASGGTTGLYFDIAENGFNANTTASPLVGIGRMQTSYSGVLPPRVSVSTMTLSNESSGSSWTTARVYDAQYVQTAGATASVGSTLDLYAAVHPAATLPASSVTVATDINFFHALATDALNEEYTGKPWTTMTGLKVDNLRSLVSIGTKPDTDRGIYILTQTGGLLNNYGIQIDAPSGGSTVNESIWLNGSTARGGVLFGTGKNARIWYDGTNMVLDSRIAGTGNFEFRSGNMSVGTSTTYAKLTVWATSTPVIANFIDTASTTVMTILANGNIGIGTTSPWRTLSVTGTVAFSGITSAIGAGSLCLTSANDVTYNSGSDACLSSLRSTKHDIHNLTVSGLDTLAALQSVSFVYNTDIVPDGRTRYGFVAEDTAAVDRHLASYDAKGALSGIDDRAILSVAVRAIQELNAKFSVPADATTTMPSAVLTADGKGIDLYKLATHTLSDVQALAEKIAAQDLYLTSLEARIASLENASITTSDISATSILSSLGSWTDSLSTALKEGITAAYESIGSDKIFAAAVGVFNKMFAHEVHTDILCVGTTCVTQEQFLEMVQSSSMVQPNSVIAPVVPTAADIPHIDETVLTNAADTVPLVATATSTVDIPALQDVTTNATTVSTDSLQEAAASTTSPSTSPDVTTETTPTQAP